MFILLVTVKERSFPDFPSYFNLVVECGDQIVPARLWRGFSWNEQYGEWTCLALLPLC